MNVNIFDLAIEQVKKEGKLTAKNNLALIVERAITIRQYLDRSNRNKNVWISRKKKK